MGSSKPYRSWRQKGIAATIAAALLWPVVDGVVQEKAPEGIFAALNRTQPIEVEREPTTLENRIDGSFAGHPNERDSARTQFPTFEYSTRMVDARPETAYRLATSLVNLGEALEPIGRVAAQNGVPKNLPVTIAVLESGGGAALIPEAYRERVADDEVAPDVPAGLFHAKLVSLEEAVQEGQLMRDRLHGYGVDLPRGWPSLDVARTAVPDEVYETLLEQYPSAERLDRALQLAAQIPKGPIKDRFDTEQGTRGAIAYIAQIDAHLQAAGVDEVTLAQILAGYTGGHNGARRAATQSNDDTIGRAVANDNGEWYTRTGEQVYTLLEQYGSIERALTSAQNLIAFRENRPDATIEMLGTLYAQAAADPNAIAAFDAYIVDQRAQDTSRWVPIAEIWDSYQDSSTLASR